MSDPKVLLAGGGGLVVLVVAFLLLGRGNGAKPVANNPAPNAGAPAPLPVANPGLPRVEPIASPSPVSPSPSIASPANTVPGNPSVPSSNPRPTTIARTSGTTINEEVGPDIESFLVKRDGQLASDVIPKAGETLLTFARQSGHSERRAMSLPAITPPNWSVQPDPLPESVTFANNRPRFPGPVRSALIAPRRLSQFVLFGQPASEFVVIDLSSMTQSKPLRAPGSDAIAISSDGSKIARVTNNDQRTTDIGIWSTSSGLLTRTLSINGRANSEMFEFLDANRLVVSLAGSGGPDRLVLIDAGSGNLLGQVDAGDDGDFQQTQITPGGRYLIHLDQKLGLIVCDTATGKRVGQAPWPRWHQHSRNVRVLASGASPDGREFAALCDVHPHLHLISWDLASGKRMLHHVLENQELQMLRLGSSRTRSIDFITGGGFLINGESWLDRQTGQVLWQDRGANQPFNIGRDSARRLLPDNRLLMVESVQSPGRPGQREQARLIAVDLNRLGSGTSASGDSVTELATLQTQNARVLTSPAEKVAWSVAPDPSRDTTTLKKPLFLANYDSGGRFESHNVLAASRVVVIDTLQSSNSSLSSASRLRAFNSDTGELLLEAPVVPQLRLMAISPGARWFATAHNLGIVSLWSFDSAQPRLAFQPRPPSGKVTLCHFVDDDTLLVVVEIAQDQHQVSLWKIPSCEQIYRLDLRTRQAPHRAAQRTITAPGNVRPLRTSHGGRYLIIDEIDRLRFLEVASGEFVGDLEIGWPRSLLHPSGSSELTAISWDGRQLAMLLPYDSFELVFLWDLQTGQPLEQFALSRQDLFTSLVGDRSKLSFCGPRQLLLDGYLLDLSHHAIVWQAAAYSPERLRFVDGTLRRLQTTTTTFPASVVGPTQGLAGQSIVLLADGVVSLAETFSAVAEKQPTPLPVVFGSGAKVRLDLSSLNQLPAEAQGRIRQTIETACRHYNVTVDPASPVTLTLAIVQKNTETQTFTEIHSPLQVGGTNSVQISGTNYELVASIGVAGAEPFWSHRRAASTLINSFETKPGESAAIVGQRIGQEVFAQTTEDFFINLQLPPQLYAQPRHRLNEKDERSRLGFGTELRAIPPPADWPTVVSESSAMYLKAFESQCQEMAHLAYAEVVAADDATMTDRWKWSPALQRPVLGVRCGIGVQYSGKKPDNAYVAPQPYNFGAVAALDQMTAGAASRLTDQLMEFSNQGRFGKWPVGRNARARDLVMLGGGALGELLNAAKATRLDVVITVHFTTPPTSSSGSKSKVPNTAMTFRLFDVQTGKLLFETTPLKAADLQKTERDASAAIADEMRNFVEEQVALQPLDELPKEVLKARLNALNSKDSPNPTADVAELQLLVRRGWATEPQISHAATRLLGDAASVRALIQGSAEERQALATKLAPRRK